MFYGVLNYAVELDILPANPIGKVTWKAPEVAEEIDRRVVARPQQVRELLAAVEAMRLEMRLNRCAAGTPGRMVASRNLLVHGPLNIRRKTERNPCLVSMPARWSVPHPRELPGLGHHGVPLLPTAMGTVRSGCCTRCSGLMICRLRRSPLPLVTFKIASVDGRVAISCSTPSWLDLRWQPLGRFER